MAKQRNSLGVVVLPVPYNVDITWEEYKKRYGIDLEEIFDSTIIGEGFTVRLKSDVTKLILLSPDKKYLANNESADIPLPLVVPTSMHSYADPEDINSGGFTIAWTGSADGFTLTLDIMSHKVVRGEFA